MGYLKKSKTLALFFLLILSIGIIVASIIIYQKSLSRLNDNLYEREEDNERLSGIIDALQNNVSGLNTKLELQIEREQNLSGQYTELKGLKEGLEADKKNLQKRINETEKELYVAKLDINQLEDEISDLKFDYAALNLSFVGVTDDVEYICNAVASMNLSRCRKYR